MNTFRSDQAPLLTRELLLFCVNLFQCLHNLLLDITASFVFNFVYDSMTQYDVVDITPPILAFIQSCPFMAIPLFNGIRPSKEHSLQ